MRIAQDDDCNIIIQANAYCKSLLMGKPFLRSNLGNTHIHYTNSNTNFREKTTANVQIDNRAKQTTEAKQTTIILFFCKRPDTHTHTHAYAHTRARARTNTHTDTHKQNKSIGIKRRRKKKKRRKKQTNLTCLNFERKKSSSSSRRPRSVPVHSGQQGRECAVNAVPQLLPVISFVMTAVDPVGCCSGHLISFGRPLCRIWQQSNSDRHPAVRSNREIKSTES